MSYYKKNLLIAYKINIIVCIAITLISFFITLSVVYSAYKKKIKLSEDTFIFHSNGASIHVYKK